MTKENGKMDSNFTDIVREKFLFLFFWYNFSSSTWTKTKYRKTILQMISVPYRRPLENTFTNMISISEHSNSTKQWPEVQTSSIVRAWKYHSKPLLMQVHLGYLYPLHFYTCPSSTCKFVFSFYAFNSNT